MAQEPTEALSTVPASAVVSLFAASVNGSSWCTHSLWLVPAQSLHLGRSPAPEVWQQVQDSDPAKKDEKKKINLIRETTTGAFLFLLMPSSPVFICSVPNTLWVHMDPRGTV